MVSDSSARHLFTLAPLLNILKTDFATKRVSNFTVGKMFEEGTLNWAIGVIQKFYETYGCKSCSFPGLIWKDIQGFPATLRDLYIYIHLEYIE